MNLKTWIRRLASTAWTCACGGSNPQDASTCGGCGKPW